MPIKPNEPLTLIFSSVRLPGLAVGGDGAGKRVSFFFKRTRENAENNNIGMHYGMVTDTMTQEEWADAFLRLSQAIRNGPPTVAGVPITHIDMELPR